MMKRCLLFLLFPLMACAQEATSDTVEPPSKEDTRRTLLAVNSDPRDEWQRPDELIAFMGGDVEGWVIADLFADDGYFTFKLIDAGARVIAIVNDIDKHDALLAKKKALGLSDDQLKVRAVPVGDPGLAPGEADAGLIVHAFPAIKDKKGYLTMLRHGLRRPSVLFMVEWQARDTPMGPPVSERMSSERIMDEFVGTGFTDLSAKAKLMPYDVLFMMTDPMEQYLDGQ